MAYQPDVDLAVPSLDGLHDRRSEKWDVEDRTLLMSTVAEMDFPLAPAITATLHAAIDRHDVGYAVAATPTLRHAFAGFAARRLGWHVDPDCVTLIPDVMTGAIELARMLAGDQGAVALATPAYPPFLAGFPPNGLAVRGVPLTDDGSIDARALDRRLTEGMRVFVLANPHNPTGRVLPRSELKALAETCAAHEAWVLADEVHAPLTLSGATHVPWLEVSDAARHRGIALTSASKAFNIAGLKSALLVTASEDAREAVRRLPPLGDRAGLLGVFASEVAFSECDAWLDAVIERLDANRALLERRLEERLPEVEWRRPDASYLAWLDCRRLGLGDDPARTFRERGRVALNSGLAYGDAGAGFVRLNFGTSAALVEEMVDRMAAAASTARRKG
jgi:cystathionine beta-lyase